MATITGTIQVRRGAAAGLPALADGEPGWTTDTHVLYVGQGGVNYVVGAGTYQPLDATLTALAAFNTNGLLTQTAADTFAGRTITGTANQITVTNGDGVAGNPTLSLPTTITISATAAAALNYVVAANAAAITTSYTRRRAADADCAASDFIETTEHKARVSGSDVTVVEVSSVYTGNGTTRSGSWSLSTYDAGSPINHVVYTGSQMKFPTHGDGILKVASNVVTSAALLASELPARVVEEWIGADRMRARATNAPATGTYTVGGAGGADVYHWAFDATNAEVVQWTHVLPKGWNGGTVSFRAIWSHAAAATFGVVWKLRAVGAGDAEDLAAPSTGTNQAVTDTGGVTDRTYHTAFSAGITVASSSASGDLIVFELFRDPASGSDTLNVDARLIGIVLQFTHAAGDDS
jgi:hypothetical protein